MKKYAVIVAGGAGTRMGIATPKQFLLLNDKPILWHTVQAFLDAYEDLEIILVLPENSADNTIKTLFTNTRISFTEGGKTRFHSVQNGLQKVEEESVVFVHDGVRCLVTKTLIQNCYKQTIKLGNAIPAVTATDSMRLKNLDGSVVLNRNNVCIIQTPQTFLSSILLPAFNQPCSDAFTDEATVVEAFGGKVFLIDGDYENIKITRPVDLIIAERILNNRLSL